MYHHTRRIHKFNSIVCLISDRSFEPSSVCLKVIDTGESWVPFCSYYCFKPHIPASFINNTRRTKNLWLERSLIFVYYGEEYFYVNFRNERCYCNWPLLNSLSFLNINIVLELKGSKRWCSWLTHCTTSRRRAGSIPDCVIGIFYWHKPSGRTVALGVDSASNRNEYQEYFLGVKGSWCVGLTILPY